MMKACQQKFLLLQLKLTVDASAWLKKASAEEMIRGKISMKVVDKTPLCQ